MLNKKISLILLLLSFFVIIGSVSASEDTNNCTNPIEENHIVQIELKSDTVNFHWEELVIDDPTKLNPNLE